MIEDRTTDIAAQPGALRRTDFQGAIRANRRNTTVLCVSLILLGVVLGYVIGWALETLKIDMAVDPDLAGSHWPGGAPDALHSLLIPTDWGVGAALFMALFGTIWTLVALTWGDRIVLSMAGAHPVTRDEEPVLYNVVEEMAIAAGVPTPSIHVVETRALNAFATGLRPERAAIGVTRGLLQTMSRDELQGVVAHEMGHVVNDDMVYATAVGVIAGLIVLVSDGALRLMRGFWRTGGGGGRRGGKGGGAAALIALAVLAVVAILAPIAARLVQMAISRQREYLADATSVRLTRNPKGLIGALEKIGASDEPYQGASRALQHLYIENPIRHFDADSWALFATHPSIAQRIERLQNL
ncbi:MAG: M48 family metallopeptidase [Candidatus Eiseniibacteriota bacterium]